MAKTAARTPRTKFQSPEPINTRPEDRIATATAERRAAAAAQRPSLFGHPSRMTVAILIFASIGFLIAAYTTYVHYNPAALICAGSSHGQSSCLTVQQSQWNNVAGIPVSVLGLAGYFGIFLSLRVPGDLGRAAGFGIALIGFLFSLYLTYREAFSIHHYCEWCLGSASCMTILMILTAVRFLRATPGA